MIPLRAKWLWIATISILLFVVIAGLLVDSNGCLPGAGELVSSVIVAALVSTGLVADGILALCDRRRWPFAIAVAVVYAVWFAPTVL